MNCRLRDLGVYDLRCGSNEIYSSILNAMQNAWEEDSNSCFRVTAPVTLFKCLELSAIFFRHLVLQVLKPDQVYLLPFKCKTGLGHQLVNDPGTRIANIFTTKKRTC
jgi:hypothetical protein